MVYIFSLKPVKRMYLCTNYFIKSCTRYISFFCSKIIQIKNSQNQAVSY